MALQRTFRPILALVLLIAVFSTAQAQSPGPAVWEVRNGDSSLFIMGSVHLLRPDANWLHPELERRFDEASLLVLEVADLREAQAVTMRLIQEHGFYPPGQSLADELEPQTFERALAMAQRLGARPEEFARMRPWLAGILLTQLWAASHGYDPGFGVDLYLNHRAATTGKPVAGLETIEEQMGILIEGLGGDAQSVMEQTLAQLEDEAYIDALVDAWLVGDMDALERLMHEAFADYPEAYEVLIAERNRRWIGQIETILADTDSGFVVVGAAHLVGPENVLELLEGRGLSVARQ
jgi:uncharacterized protein